MPVYCRQKINWEEIGGFQARGSILIYQLLKEIVWDIKKVFEMGSGNNCTTLWMHLTPLNYTLKMTKIVNMSCIFYNNFYC